MPERALITPDVLAWARGRAQMSAEALASKIQTSVDKLQSWESGEAKPTIKQAQTIAKKLHIPFGYLFLSTPPEEQLPK